jgi:hypothetical protein
MKKNTALLLFTLFINSFGFGQDKLAKKADELMSEGKKLYRLEMASWYGTDVLLEKLNHNKNKVGGYFSYNQDELTTCLFHTQGEEPKVLYTITFDPSFNTQTALIDSTERALTKNEKDLYTIRRAVLPETYTDTIFKMYENTSFNLIPIIENGEKKVYVLTGPKTSGAVILGNDYLLTYNDKNEVISTKALHKNILVMDYGSEGNEVITMHSHLPSTGDFITATDICTLLLYEKMAYWKQHMVISKKYVSIWDCKTDQLVILIRKAWEKMNK